MKRHVSATTVAIGLFLSLATASMQAQELGRLFMTPEEREMLERLRAAPPRPPAPPVQPSPVTVVEPPPPEEVLPPPQVPPITVNGVVLRSRGDGTVWVNGQNTYEGDFGDEHIRIDRPRSVAVPIDTPEHLPNVRLKPGQTYDPATNTIVDGYQQSR
ncbi:MAG: hypothetical protein ACT4NU_07085 [Chromatiales bacterium]